MRFHCRKTVLGGNLHESEPLVRPSLALHASPVRMSAWSTVNRIKATRRSAALA
jgi:hypothetical protein